MVDGHVEVAHQRWRVQVQSQCRVSRIYLLHQRVEANSGFLTAELRSTNLSSFTHSTCYCRLQMKLREGNVFWAPMHSTSNIAGAKAVWKYPKVQLHWAKTKFYWSLPMLDVNSKMDFQWTHLQAVWHTLNVIGFYDSFTLPETDSDMDSDFCPT